MPRTRLAVPCFLLLLAGSAIATLVGCAKDMDAPLTINGYPTCVLGQHYEPQTSTTLAVSTPVVKNSLAVIGILQKDGPLPKDYGEDIKQGVNAGRVEKFISNDDVLVYFPTQARMPATIPWVDPRGVCIGNAEVLKASQFPGWSHFKMKQWGVAGVPRYLVPNDSLCVRAWTFKVAPVPELARGSFKHVASVICSYPGQIEASLGRGHGTFFTFIAAIP